MVDGHPATGAVPPSGRQVEIVHGEQRATIVEVGGGIRSYSVAGRDILDAYAVAEMCSGGRGQVLLPWPNRIAGGRYTFEGRDHQLPLNEPSAGNAIHGLVRWVSWDVVAQAPDRARLRHRLHPQPGYPFDLDLEIEYVLDANGLTVRTTATNIGRATCPFGSGAHPYLRVGEGPIDTARLQVGAATVLRSDDRGIPTHRLDVPGTAYDFRTDRAIGRTVLDHAMTDLRRAEDGRAWVSLAGEDGTTVRLWMSDQYRFVMLFTGDTLGELGRRSLAVEPMTSAPNAFVSGDGLIVLQPGETFSGTWGIAPEIRT